MKYQLSFCEIEQISDNVFEITHNEGTIINKECADESWNFWDKLRDKPFGFLINCNNTYKYSFEGSQVIGKHPFRLKTAMFCNDDKKLTEMKTAVELKKMMENSTNHRFFTDKAEAINWLSDI